MIDAKRVDFIAVPVSDLAVADRFYQRYAPYSDGSLP